MLKHTEYQRAIATIKHTAQLLEEAGEEDLARYLRLSLANLSQYKDQVEAHIESLLNEAWRFTDDGMIENWED